MKNPRATPITMASAYHRHRRDMLVTFRYHRRTSSRAIRGRLICGDRQHIEKHHPCDLRHAWCFKDQLLYAASQKDPIVRPQANDTPDDRHTIEACERLTQAAQGMHIAEHDSGGANPKVLHEWEHVETMFRQAKEIGQILGFSRRQQALVKTIIAHHDLVLDVQFPPEGDLNALVVRNRGVAHGALNRDEKGSEGKSADALKRAMEAENEQARMAGKPDVFSEQELMIAVWAIHATCPDPLTRQVLR